MEVEGEDEEVGRGQEEVYREKDAYTNGETERLRKRGRETTEQV